MVSLCREWGWHSRLPSIAFAKQIVCVGLREVGTGPLR